MIEFRGHPQDGPLYDGYDVVRDGQTIGFIDVCGYFRNDAHAVFTEAERLILEGARRRVYEMPSEYGWLGVGDRPTVPFEEFHARNPR